ncbi:MAG: hypothetical protein H0T60_12110 [Acidobacteria bacterium]|nr:hypothetical protein [Acidobacteriota bacterium]
MTDEDRANRLLTIADEWQGIADNVSKQELEVTERAAKLMEATRPYEAEYVRRTLSPNAFSIAAGRVRWRAKTGDIEAAKREVERFKGHIAYAQRLIPSALATTGLRQLRRADKWRGAVNEQRQRQGQLRHEIWQTAASAIWAEEPNLNASEVARRIAKEDEKVGTIRKAIKKAGNAV